MSEPRSTTRVPGSVGDTPRDLAFNRNLLFFPRIDVGIAMRPPPIIWIRSPPVEILKSYMVDPEKSSPEPISILVSPHTSSSTCVFHNVNWASIMVAQLGI